MGAGPYKNGGVARGNYRLRVTFADGLFVGTGGLAAARSTSRSDSRTGLSFIALVPLRYPDGPLRNFKTRPHLISRADGLTEPSPVGEGVSRACGADIFPLAEIADDG